MSLSKTSPKPPVRLRNAARDDLSRLLELETMFPGDRLSERQFRHHLSSASARLRIIEHDDKIGGYALLLLRRGISAARLYSLAIDPALRGYGLGMQLFDDVRRQAHAAGCNLLRLEVRLDNTAAISLYRRAGCTESGLIPDYYDDGCAALRFECGVIDSGADIAD